MPATTQHPTAADTLAEIRISIARGLNLLILLTGLPVVVGAVRNQLQFGWTVYGIVSLGCYLSIAAAVIFSRRIPYILQAGVLLFALSGVGVSATLQHGMIGSGTFAVVVVTVLATMLLGWRAGLGMAVVATAFLTWTAVGFSSGRLTIAFDLDAYAASSTAWTMRIFTIISFMTVLSSVMWYMQKRLTVLAQQEFDRVEELQLTLEKLKEEEAQRRKTEDMLQQSQKLESLGILAGGIAHDLNNILHAVYGYSDIAMGELQADTPAHDAITQVSLAATRASDLVKQILTFSRKGEGKRSLVWPHEIVNEAIEMLKVSLPGRIEIRTNIDSSCGPILADATQIHHVIINLCTNAYHAMRDVGGELKVSLDPVERIPPREASGDLDTKIPMIRICVGDTGHGMDEKTCERIFEPFFTTKETGKGTGLGLSIVQGIVESHFGDVVVESELKKGTTVTIHLPVNDSAVPEPAAKVHSGEGRGEHILYLDDEDAIAKLGTKVLTRRGYEVSTFSESTEALEEIRAHPTRYDIVVTDQNMPKMTGMELAEEIYAFNSTIPIILVTGAVESLTSEDGEANGIRAVLAKPMSMSELSAQIRTVLDSEEAR